MTRGSNSLGHNTRIKIESEEEYAWLNSVRKGLGLTWRGLMLKAEQRLLASEQDWPARECKVDPEPNDVGDGPGSDDVDAVTGTEGT